MSAYSPSFSLTTTALLDLIDRASSVVPGRGDLLKSFQIKAYEDDTLEVIATDLQLSMVVSSSWVTVTRPGITVLPADKLLAIVKTAQEGTISIEVTARTAVIEAGRAKWTLQLKFNAADFPPMPDIDAPYREFPAPAFIHALSTVKGAASDTQENLQAIQLTPNAARASDRARVQEVALDDFPAIMVLPLAAVGNLLSLMKASGEPVVGIAQTENHLLFRVGSAVLVSQKNTYSYPDVETMLLRPVLTNSHQLGITRDDMLAALARVRINADPNASAVRISLSQGQATISAHDTSSNTSSETIACDWAGKDHDIVVNARMFIEVLKTHTDAATFWLGDDTRGLKPSVLIKEDNQMGVVPQMHVDWL